MRSTLLLLNLWITWLMATVLGACSTAAVRPSVPDVPNDASAGTTDAPADAMVNRVADATAAVDAIVDAGSACPTEPSSDAGRTPIFVAVGGGTMLTSRDGVTWGNAADFPPPMSQDWGFSGLAIGNGVIVTTGQPGVYSSTDGIRWTRAQLPDAQPNYDLGSTEVVFGHGMFVLVSGSDSYTSIDGVNWMVAHQTGSATHWTGLAYGCGHFVAVGNEWATVTPDSGIDDGGPDAAPMRVVSEELRKVSEDGLNWHDYVVNTLENGGHVGDWYGLTDILGGPVAADGLAYGNGVFVAVGLQGRYATSTDGVNWISSPPADSGSGFAWVNGLAFVDGSFLLSADLGSGEGSCGILTTSKGVVWADAGMAVNEWSQISYGAGRYVALSCNATNIVTSTDGKSWATDMASGSYIRIAAGEIAP